MVDVKMKFYLGKESDNFKFIDYISQNIRKSPAYNHI